jgi:hypothetical protein
MEACQRLVEYTEKVSSNYGLKLNKGKCINLNMNTDLQQKFWDGESIQPTKDATYLGNVLSYKADPHMEVSQKIQEVNRALWKLTDYWKASDASRKWKLLIFDAVIKSKLLYGLETTELPKSCKKRLDAFQIKGLRRILGQKHSYWDRSATNAKILELATEEAYRKGNAKHIAKNAERKIELFSSAYKKRRKKLLGHIIRTENNDPLRQVSLKPDSAIPLNWGTRRLGKPRQKWTESTMKKVRKQLRHEAPKIKSSNPFRKRKYKASSRQHKFIFEWAKERKF